MFYTYKLIWTTHGKWYYGVRYAKNANPNDLLKTYFTSSRHVKRFIEENGMPDVAKVTKIFPTKEEAIEWEHKFLSRTQAHLNSNSLNLTTNKAIHPYHLSKATKGKSYEEIHGIEKALVLKRKRSDGNRNRTKVVWSDDSKQKISDKYSGSGNPKAIKVQLKTLHDTYNFDSVKECCHFICQMYDILELNSFHQHTTRILRLGRNKYNESNPYYLRIKDLYISYV